MSDAKTPVRHRMCGQIMGYYLSDRPANPDILRAADYERLDGSKPAYGEKFREYCPHCEDLVIQISEVRRCFEEAA